MSFGAGVHAVDVQIGRQGVRQKACFDHRDRHPEAEAAAAGSGGGNAKKLTFDHGRNIKIISNQEGLLGAMALWRDWQ